MRRISTVSCTWKVGWGGLPSWQKSLIALKMWQHGKRMESESSRVCHRIQASINTCKRKHWIFTLINERQFDSECHIHLEHYPPFFVTSLIFAGRFFLPLHLISKPVHLNKFPLQTQLIHGVWWMKKSWNKRLTSLTYFCIACEYEGVPRQNSGICYQKVDWSFQYWDLNAVHSGSTMDTKESSL